MFDLNELFALDPAAAPDEAFDGYLPHGYANRVPGLMQPIKAHVGAIFQQAYDAGNGARALANVAQGEMRRRLDAVGPAPGATGVDQNRELDRGVRDQIRVWLQFARYFTELLEAAAKNQNVPAHFQRWPSVPPAMPASPRPMFEREAPAFDLAGWMAERADVLLDSSRVRVTGEGRALAVRGFDDADLALLRANELTVAQWIGSQFQPVAAAFLPFG
jgi:hypothetical protein